MYRPNFEKNAALDYSNRGKIVCNSYFDQFFKEEVA